MMSESEKNTVAPLEKWTSHSSDEILVFADYPKHVVRKLVISTLQESFLAGQPGSLCVNKICEHY
jgi:hypothetical protein